MPYCSRCGVEVDSDVDNCPLCHIHIYKTDAEGEIEYKKYPDHPVKEDVGLSGLTMPQRLKIAIEIVTLFLVIPTIITLLADLSTASLITWSRYPALSLVLVWCLVCFPLLLYKNPLFLIISLVISITGFLAAMDYFDNWALDWFLDLALPVIILISVITAIVVFSSLLVRIKGVNVAAFILFGIGLLSLGLDLIISSAISGVITISWSVVVMLVVFSLGVIFLYLHYRIKNLDSLKRRFHV